MMCKNKLFYSILISYDVFSSRIYVPTILYIFLEILVTAVISLLKERTCFITTSCVFSDIISKLRQQVGTKTFFYFSLIFCFLLAFSFKIELRSEVTQKQYSLLSQL